MIKFHVIRPFKVGDIVMLRNASDRGMTGVVRNVWDSAPHYYSGVVTQRVRVEWSNGSSGFYRHSPFDSQRQLRLID